MYWIFNSVCSHGFHRDADSIRWVYKFFVYFRISLFGFLEKGFSKVLNCLKQLLRLVFRVSRGQKDAKDLFSSRVYVYGYGEVMDKMTLLDNPTRRAILYLLATEGALTLKEIADRLGLAPSTVFDHLKRLKSSGIISEAEDQPKRFKVEVYYKLSIPFFFVSELEELRRRLEPIIEEYSEYVKKVFERLKSSLENIDLRCVKRKSAELDLVAATLISSLHSLVLTELNLVPPSLLYIVINDKEQADKT